MTEKVVVCSPFLPGSWTTFPSNWQPSSYL